MEHDLTTRAVAARPAAAGRRCPACGAAFGCGLADGAGACWCANLPHVLAVPKAGEAACLCPDCLRGAVAAAEGADRMPSVDLDATARRHGVSAGAARAVWEALRRTGGQSAQFDHPDLGGPGQWMPGMTMVGNWSDPSLKARVDGLCSELAGVLQAEGGAGVGSSDAPGGSREAWWPEELGNPTAAGGQDDLRYAYFAGPRRLAVWEAGRVTVYDTGEHRIGGVSQRRRDGRGAVMFTSQHGEVDLASMKVVR